MLGRPEKIRRPTTQRSPSLAPAFGSATDARDPRDSERKQGTEGDDGAAAVKFADGEFPR